jgi:predicted N-acetyltransferase YhbS
MFIRKYESCDFDKVMEIIALEGEEWYDYSASENKDKYRKALDNSIVYVAFEDNEVCGFARFINDNDLLMILSDLLVTPKFRGNGIGHKLMESVYDDYPQLTAYAMSDVDEYYAKQGYQKVGSIFKIPTQSENI